MNEHLIKEAEELVDMMLDGTYNVVKKIEAQVDASLDNISTEAVDNEIPEEPDEGKTPGKNVKKEVSGENVNNTIPEEPDKGKKPSKAIKDEIVNDKSSVKTRADAFDNTIPEVPDDAKTAGKKLKKELEG